MADGVDAARLVHRPGRLVQEYRVLGHAFNYPGGHDVTETARFATMLR